MPRKRALRVLGGAITSVVMPGLVSRGASPAANVVVGAPCTCTPGPPAAQLRGSVRRGLHEGVLRPGQASFPKCCNWRGIDRALTQQRQLQLHQQAVQRTGLSGTHDLLLPGEHLLRRHRGRGATLHHVYSRWTPALRPELLQAGRALYKCDPFRSVASKARSAAVRRVASRANAQRESRSAASRVRPSAAWEEMLPREPGVLRWGVPLRARLAPVRK